MAESVETDVTGVAIASAAVIHLVAVIPSAAVIHLAAAIVGVNKYYLSGLL